MSAAKAATQKCGRCGKRARLFWHGRRELCEKCIGRVKHPIEASPVTAGNVLRGVMELLRGVGAKAALVAILFQLPLAALILWSDAGAVLGALWGLVAILGTGMVIELCLAHVGGEDARLGPAFGVAARSWIGLVFAGLISSLVIAVFALLLVVPGILRALSYALIYPLIVDGDARSTDALALSKERMKGHRWAAFLAFVVAFVPPVLWLALMGEAAGSVFDPYATIPPEARAQTALYTVVDAVLYVPITLVGVVLHLKLRRPTPVTDE